MTTASSIPAARADASTEGRQHDRRWNQWYRQDSPANSEREVQPQRFVEPPHTLAGQRTDRPRPQTSDGDGPHLLGLGLPVRGKARLVGAEEHLRCALRRSTPATIAAPRPASWRREAGRRRGVRRSTPLRHARRDLGAGRPPRPRATPPRAGRAPPSGPVRGEQAARLAAHRRGRRASRDRES
jgi:hypothetical protein